MNLFVRTLIYGLAALCLVLLTAGVVALAGLRSAGVITPEKIRDLLITPEERGYIAQMNKMRRGSEQEPPASGPSGPRSLHRERTKRGRPPSVVR